MNQNLESLILEPRKSDSNPVVSDKVDAFLKDFNHYKLEIHHCLEDSKNIDKRDIINHFDNVTLKLQKLQKLLADSTVFLPSYVIRTSLENLKELENAVKTAQSLHLPKKKFAFKSRVKENSKVNNELSEPTNDEVDNTLKKIHLPSCTFQNESNKTLQKNPEELSGKDVELNNITNCSVLLFGTPNTVHLSKVKSSKLFIGPVITSVFIEDCSSCIFVAACQQLRVHSTKQCDFYLHVVSNPIIEDCTDVRFAPYSLEYELLNNHFDFSRLDKDVNKWNLVNDFNWLALDVHSPNWNLIPVEERCTWSF